VIPIEPAAPASAPTDRAARAIAARRRAWVPVCLLFVASSAGYLTAAHQELFFDSRQLRDDPLIRSVGASARRLWQSGLLPGQELSNLSFALNCAMNRTLGLPDFHTTGFLVFNVLLHAANALLVYRLAERLLARGAGDPQSGPIIPAAAAALFAAHPIHSASVAYILQRRGVLAATFYLLGLLACLRLRSGGSWSRRTLWLAAVLASFLLSIKCRNTALTFPFALLAIEFCLRAADERALKRAALWLGGGAALASLLCVLFLHGVGQVDFGPLRANRPVVNPVPWGVTEQFLTQCRVAAEYWGLLLLPLPGRLSIDHDYPISRTVLDRGVLAALGLHVSLLIFALLAARRQRAAMAFGVLLFYVALLPGMFIPQPEQLVEYKVYLSSAGAALCAADLLQGAGIGRRPRLLGTTAVIVVAALILMNLKRNALYRDAVLLWADAAAKSPGNDRAVGALAIALEERGRIAEAETAYRRAIEIRPDDPDHRYNLAKLLVAAGRTEEGLAEYRRILARRPEHFPARYNLANALYRDRRYEEAAEEYRTALHYAPDDYRAHFNLANTLRTLGRTGEAIRHYREVLRLRPDHAAARRAVADHSASSAPRTADPP